MAVYELSADDRKKIIETLTPDFDEMHRQTSPGAYASLINKAIDATLSSLPATTQEPAVSDVAYSIDELSADGMIPLQVASQENSLEERSA